MACKDGVDCNFAHIKKERKPDPGKPKGKGRAHNATADTDSAQNKSSKESKALNSLVEEITSNRGYDSCDETSNS